MTNQVDELFAHTGALKNGVRVATREMPTLQSVAVGIFIDVGSRDESNQQAGISHALEHMVFKGTQSLDVHQLAEALDDLGGNANAFTSRERTCFHTHVLHEDWQQGLRLLSEMLLNPDLPEAEWQREREVIFAEMSMVEDAPDEWVDDQHMGQVYASHNLGKPVLGTKQALNGLSSQDLRDYLNFHYRGERVLIAAAGNIKHDDLCAFVETLGWQDSAAQHREPRQQALIHSGKHEISRNMEQAQVVASWAGIPVTSNLRPTAWIANQLFGGSMSSILFREIREKRGLAYSVGSHLSTYTDTGLLSVSCSTMPDQLDECLSVLNDTISDVCAGVGNDMIRRAQRQLTVQFRMGMDSVEGSMLSLGALLDNEVLYTPLQWVEKIQLVEPEQVQAFLTQHLQNQAMWTIASPSNN